MISMQKIKSDNEPLEANEVEVKRNQFERLEIQHKDQKNNNNFERKIGRQMYRYFQRQTDEISQEKIWTWSRKRNIKSRTESLLIGAQTMP